MLKEALDHRHFDIVAILLKDPRIDPSTNSNEIIKFACSEGYFELVEQLSQDKRVIPTSECLVEACRGGHLKIVILLLMDARVRPPDEALKIASRTGHLS